MKKTVILLFVIVSAFISCTKDDGDSEGIETKQVTIFFVNDVHGQLDNFSKIKHIVDLEKQKTNVIVACGGDMFSGNPVVDNYTEKGFPMIDIMNKVGFDVLALGNHEFDYGESVLKDRMEQADFKWVCANVDMGSTEIPGPSAFITINIDDLNIIFFGLVETNGKEDATIPSTHPWRVENLSFKRPENVVSQYANLKEQENADLYIALTHLGYSNYKENLGDVELALQHPYFDMIIGGHSHQKIDTVIKEIPIFQSGSYLNYLGKIEVSVRDRNIESINYTLINLNSYIDFDAGLKDVIDEYNDLPYLKDVIGFSHLYHKQAQVGCFYTDALRTRLDVDVSFQNTGGIRSGLDEGDITKREIFEITPFNNGTVIYEMSVSEIKKFLVGSGSGFYYSGIQIEQKRDEIEIVNLNGKIIPDEVILSIGVNDYIPSVHEKYFPKKGEVQALTDAEIIISYLETINDQVNYSNSNHYFRYQ